MYPYIRCFCGRSLGDIYEAFEAMKAARYAEIYGDDAGQPNPFMFQIADSVQVEIGDILSALNVHLDCCRARLLTQVQYTDVY